LSRFEKISKFEYKPCTNVDQHSKQQAPIVNIGTGNNILLDFNGATILVADAATTGKMYTPNTHTRRAPPKMRVI